MAENEVQAVNDGHGLTLQVRRKLSGPERRESATGIGTETSGIHVFTKPIYDNVSLSELLPFLRPQPRHSATFRYFGEIPLGCERDKSKDRAPKHKQASSGQVPTFSPPRRRFCAVT
jgi:hypothetical protein